MSDDDDVVDEIRRRVTRDPGFAIAYALLQLAAAYRAGQQRLDRIGGELQARLKAIADAIDRAP
jgi:hypothetical protein